MKEDSLMRVLVCKIHCPYICFCKPSAAHIYTSAPLKLQNTPHHVAQPAPFAVCNHSDKSSSEEVMNGKQESKNYELKSCIRKSHCRAHAEEVDLGKKRVQWMDNFGKELAEIKEFESSETGDTDNEEESSRCLCVIL